MKTRTAKRMRVGLVVTVCAALLGSASAQTLSTPDEILTFCETKAKAVTAWSADMKTIMPPGPMAPTGMTQTGKIKQKKPNRIRAELKTTMGQQQIDMLIVHDGKIMWTENRMAGAPVTVMKMDEETLKKMGGNSPGNASMDWESLLTAEQVKKRYDVKSLGVQTDGATKVYVLQLDPKADADSTPAGAGDKATRIYVDTTTGLPVKVEALNDDGSIMATMEYANYKINPTLSDSLFTYTAPPGAQVMDMSQMMRNLPQAPPAEGE